MVNDYRDRRKQRKSTAPSYWYRYYDPHLVEGYPVTVEDLHCIDYHNKEVREDGTLPPTDFVMDRKTYHMPRVYGTRYDDQGNLVLRFNGRPIQVEPADPSIGWTNIEDGKSDYDFVRDLLSSTNPFRPTISVPVLILDLAEAATLFSIEARTLAALPGSTYLNYKFGWEQTYRDLFTLAKITKQVESRIKEFNSLVKKGGLRRRLKLGTFTWSGAYFTNYPLVSDFYVGINSDWQARYTSKVWGTVRWRPKGYNPTDLIPVGPLETFNAAVTAVFDLGPTDHQTIWESIPFSWLADYFFSVSDSMLAVQESDVVEPYDICIMRHRSSVKNIRGYQYNPGPNDDFHVSSGTSFKVTKLRKVFNQAPAYEDLLRFGWFTTNQAITVAALLTSLQRLV